MKLPHRYRIFDVPLASEFPLPELPVMDGTATPPPRLEVVRGVPAGWDRGAFRHALDWPGPDGRPICSVARLGDDYWFEFPGHAGFFITAAGRFHCLPQAKCEERLLRHFLLNQAIPRYLGSSGRMLLHASAVALPDGRVVAFVGRSGAGKSTLAASFLRTGARLLADDCLLLEPLNGAVQVLGAYPGLRLRDADVNVLFTDRRGFSAADNYSGKRQAVIASAPLHPPAEWQPLAALYLLAEPGQAGSEVEIESVPGAQAMLACLQAAFSLDPGTEASTVTAFEAVGRVMAQGFPVYLLHYPRRHEALDAVHAAVLRGLPRLQPKALERV